MTDKTERSPEWERGALDAFAQVNRVARDWRTREAVREAVAFAKSDLLPTIGDPRPAYDRAD